MSTMYESVDKASLPPVGFISLDIHFHRPPGDPFNHGTFPFPVIRAQAEGSTESQVVSADKYDSAFIERFAAAGQKLASQGCVGIITSCGFLAMAQNELATRLPVPIATSSLLQVPSILTFLPRSKKVGVLTYDDARLHEGHLRELGIDTGRVYIRGPPAEGHLRDVIARGGRYAHAEIAAELCETARVMLVKNPDTAALVLECTQMPPFAEEIQKAVGPNVPVYDVFTMASWFYSGLVRRRPVAWGAVDT